MLVRGLAHTKKELPGLSESFKVDGCVVKYVASPEIFYLKNSICKEMPSTVAGRY